MRLLPSTATLAAAALLAAASPAPALAPGSTSGAMADTLGRVRAAGRLACGTVSEPQDWNKDDLHGALEPLDIAMCQAVAVAALGTGAAVNVVRYPAEQDAEAALKAGAVDLVAGVTPGVTPVFQYGIRFSPPEFYDAQGFLVRRDAGAADLAGLAGKVLCYVEGTDSERVLQSRLAARGIAALPESWQEQGELDDALLTGRCQAVSADLSKLAETRASFHDPAAFAFLPETLTLHPAALAYRQGDERWAALVDWTVHALVSAEALGVTKASIANAPASNDPALQRLTGADWATASALGMPHDWAEKVVEAVGNYGEIYDRSVGRQSPLDLPRGLNALWTQGGLMHPMPVQ